RNGERHVAEAIASVLGQSGPPVEIVVVDDGSTDDTAGVLARFGDAVRVVHQPARGAAAGLNRGVAMTMGDVIAFLDADDLWTPDALARRLARLDRPDIPDGVFGRTTQFVSPELSEDEIRLLRFGTGPASVPLLGALVVRREVVERVGPFDESLPSAEGVDWVTRARDAGVNLVAIDDVVLCRRLHAANTGRTLPRETTLGALRRVVHAHHRRHNER
ncbi:MAG: glycosyltransferase family 2 protein, partial [Acidimicrobiia bacterium]|nr:glycosyltransferase family 2 protein [Acidimicrobiia bacterium]